MTDNGENVSLILSFNFPKLALNQKNSKLEILPILAVFALFDFSEFADFGFARKKLDEKPTSDFPNYALFSKLIYISYINSPNFLVKVLEFGSPKFSNSIIFWGFRFSPKNRNLPKMIELGF